MADRRDDLLRLLARGCGTPAARELALTLLRIEERRARERQARPPVATAPSRIDQIGACVCLAVFLFLALFLGGVMTEVGHVVSFELPVPPASKKNGRRLLQRGRRKFWVPSVKAVQSERSIADAAREACGGAMPFGPNDAVAIYYQHNIATDRVSVRVVKVGTLPTKGKRGTKRDSHGMVETIADGLQGVLYPNDNQVESGAWERVRSPRARK